MTNEMDYSPIRYVGNGATTEFAFNWKAFSDSDLIVKLIDSNENEETLVLGEDYSVKIESAGGNVIFSTAPDSDKIIFIARDVSNYQSASYSTSVGFQGSELEKSFDKVSCNLQEMDYNIETFKTEFSEEINELIEENKEDTDSQIAEFSEKIEAEISSFEDEINSTISTVNEAASVITTTIATVEDAVETCITQASAASNSAEEAQEKAQEANEQAAIAQEAAAQAIETLENKADVDLSNLSATGLSQYNVFCVNTGDTDDDGNPSFLTLSETTEDEVTTYTLETSGEFSLTSADGTIYTISDTLSYSSSDLEDGEYNILINPADNEIVLTTNTITAGSAFPSDAVSGDYLLNISKVPYDLEQITITTTTDEEGTETTTSTITKGLNLVLAGTLAISGGSLKMNNYNENLITSKSSADINLSNITDTAKISISGICFPSTKYIDLTLGATGTSYIAPSDGWYYIQKINGDAERFVNLVNSTTGITVRGVGTTATATLYCNLPVRKGETMTLNYNATGSTGAFRFYYAAGSESEA